MKLNIPTPTLMGPHTRVKSTATLMVLIWLCELALGRVVHIIYEMTSDTRK